jgi:hypothetical protein
MALSQVHQHLGLGEPPTREVLGIRGTAVEAHKERRARSIERARRLGGATYQI